MIFHLYAYLKQKHNSRLALDPTYPQVDMRSFHKADWTDFYGDISGVVPNNAQNQGERRSNCICLLTQIMLMTRPD